MTLEGLFIFNYLQMRMQTFINGKGKEMKSENGTLKGTVILRKIVVNFGGPALRSDTVAML